MGGGRMDEGEGGGQCFQKRPETKPNNYMNHDLI